jgi:hypothetical protein
LDRFENLRVFISEDQRGVVAGEIEQPIAIDIEQPAAITFFQNDGIRRIEERTARVGARKILAALQKIFVGGRGHVTIESFHLG